MSTTKPFSKRLVRRGLDAIDSRPRARRLLRRLSRTGVVHRSVWSRLSADPVFTVTLFGGELRFVYEPRDQIANTLFWRGCYEEETSRIFAILARNANRVIDVGANTGFFTLLACLVGSRASVTAFEPVPRIFDILVRNVGANRWPGRCDLRSEAVADRCGTTKFHVPESSVPTSASMHATGFRGARGRLIDTPIVTIDSICDPTERVDLVKIDVEGFEHLVLGGMAETLARWRPNLVLECNPDGPAREIENCLLPLGYRFLAIRRHRVVPCDRLTPDSTERFRNFLCTTDDSIVDRINKAGRA